MTRWNTFILAALLAFAWLAATVPQRVVISGDDVIPLLIERPTPRYSAPVAVAYSAAPMVAVPTACTTTLAASTSAASTIAYTTTGVTR